MLALWLPDAPWNMLKLLPVDVAATNHTLMLAGTKGYTKFSTSDRTSSLCAINAETTEVRTDDLSGTVVDNSFVKSPVQPPVEESRLAAGSDKDIEDAYAGSNDHVTTVKVGRMDKPELAITEEKLSETKRESNVLGSSDSADKSAIDGIVPKEAPLAIGPSKLKHLKGSSS